MGIDNIILTYIYLCLFLFTAGVFWPRKDLFELDRDYFTADDLHEMADYAEITWRRSELLPQPKFFLIVREEIE